MSFRQTFTLSALVSRYNTRFMALSVAVLASAGSSFGFLFAEKAHASDLLAHRAVYQLSLQSSERDSGIESAAGLYIFDVQGSACQGWYISSDMILSIGVASGATVRTQTRYQAFEDGEGNVFTYETRTEVNEDEPELVTGAAERLGTGGLSIRHIAAEENRTDAVPETLFPNQLTRALLSAAVNGDRVFFSTVFDGSHEHGLAQPASAVIGAPIAPSVLEPRGEASSSEGDARPQRLESLPPPQQAWPITLSYFDPLSPDTGPDFEVEFKLDTNGIADALVLHYGAFTLTGELANLEAYVSEPCGE